MRENLIPQVEQHLWSVRFRRPMFYFDIRLAICLACCIDLQFQKPRVYSYPKFLISPVVVSNSFTCQSKKCNYTNGFSASRGIS